VLTLAMSASAYFGHVCKCT